jgi:hypothetical protein
VKVKVNIPLQAAREYIDDFDDATIPNVGDSFDDLFIVAKKVINGNVCILDLVKRQVAIYNEDVS